MGKQKTRNYNQTNERIHKMKNEQQYETLEGFPKLEDWVNSFNPTGFTPSNDLEGKALYLEETLEKMQTFRNFLWRKRGYLLKTKQCTKTITEKLKSVDEGIDEVYQKCQIIWQDVRAS